MTQSKNTTHTHYQQLQFDERGQIEALYEQGMSIRQIARRLHRNPSTISREIRRGTAVQIDSQQHCTYSAYFAETGEAVYRKHRSASVWSGLFSSCSFFINLLTKALKTKPRVYSVDTFVHWFKQNYPSEVCPSTSTVYRYINDQRLLLRNQDLPMKLRRRIKHHGRHHNRTNKKVLGQSIELRPSIVESRSEFGHWEGDLVKAKRVESEPALMTLTERFSRLEIIVKLPNYHAQTCQKALQTIIDDYGAQHFQTVTFDNGSEFSLLNNVSGTDIFFAHPYSPWERGTNENTNGLLREFFPKGKSFKDSSLVDIQEVQYTLNHRPRKRLGYKCPADIVPELAD
jgi:IS30 family transposase